MKRFAGCLAVMIAMLGACHRPTPPERLVPPHAVVVRELAPHDERCFDHREWVLRATAADVERWAKDNDLPCASGTTPCTRWSTSERQSPFWKGDTGGVQGLDSVDAKLAGTELTVDWGDYTCSGPFG